MEEVRREIQYRVSTAICETEPGMDHQSWIGLSKAQISTEAVWDYLDTEWSRRQHSKKSFRMCFKKPGEPFPKTA